MARRIDNVDLDVAPPDRGVFGKNGDPSLPFERVGVEYALLNVLVITKNTRLTKHAVHQRGLAMIHMCDDGDVPDFHVLVGRRL